MTDERATHLDAGRAVHNLNRFFKVLHKSVGKNSKIEKK